MIYANHLQSDKNAGAHTDSGTLDQNVQSLGAGGRGAAMDTLGTTTTEIISHDNNTLSARVKPMP